MPDFHIAFICLQSTLDMQAMHKQMQRWHTVVVL